MTKHFFFWLTETLDICLTKHGGHLHIKHLHLHLCVWIFLEQKIHSFEIRSSIKLYTSKTLTFTEALGLSII